MNEYIESPICYSLTTLDTSGMHMSWHDRIEDEIRSAQFSANLARSEIGGNA